jgi:hypothetical protein
MVAARLTFIPWIAVCLLMLAHGYARQLWPAANLPALLPLFHWLFHLRCAGLLLVGFGLYRIVVVLAGLVSRGLFFLPPRKLPVPLALLAVLAIILPFQYPRFARRFDFTQARQHALDLTNTPGFAQASNWLRHSTNRDAVVLAPRYDAVTVAGSAGRKTVMVDIFFSNPYVPFEPRAAAAETMSKTLADHDRNGFFAAAAKYHVSYILLNDARSPSDPRTTAPFVTKVYSSDVYTILRVN